MGTSRARGGYALGAHIVQESSCRLHGQPRKPVRITRTNVVAGTGGHPTGGRPRQVALPVVAAALAVTATRLSPNANQEQPGQVVVKHHSCGCCRQLISLSTRDR